MGCKKRDGIQVVWVVAKISKKSFLSTGFSLIIQPLSCVSLLTIGPQTTMLCNLALISADSQIERRSSEAGSSVRGCNEWLAGHLTVGYQRDNNVWRQAGAVYVLQKNNCYPFKSHFLIGLAVVEGNLERRQVRERLRVRQRERVRRGQGERRAEERKSLLLTTYCVPACVYVYMSGGLVQVLLRLLCTSVALGAVVMEPIFKKIFHTRTHWHCSTHRLNGCRLTATEM